jgi:hypothetical protein
MQTVLFGNLKKYRDLGLFVSTILERALTERMDWIGMA